jgi:hypothetical protein
MARGHSPANRRLGCDFYFSAVNIVGDPMIIPRACWSLVVGTLVTLTLLSSVASAITVRGKVEPAIPGGDYMALTMTIDDATTRFELTGPDYSWFAFGFDTTTMRGYALIVEGLDATRTVVEQNLVGIGNPGGPQATQNLNLFSTVHDAANDLTTLFFERANNTGDPNDPVFSPSMTSLDIIWGRDAFASPTTPSPDLSYHGSDGRGFAKITFAVVPEPASLLLVILSLATFMTLNRHPR